MANTRFILNETSYFGFGAREVLLDELKDAFESEDFEIVETKRIGIDYSEEAKDFLWRFYIKNNNFISKK